MEIEEFNRLAAKTKMSERTIRLAKAVLVDGKGYTEVASEENVNGGRCTTQRVYRAAKRVRREKIKEDGVPSSWVCLTVVVPKEVSHKVKEFEFEQKRKIGLKVI